MKKFVALVLSAGVIFGSVNMAYAQKMAVKSDIKAYIDYTPIKSYNVEGYTYVIAEELRNYGFDVVWSNEERSLRIIRQELTTPIYTKELAEGYPDTQGSFYRIYDTDIKTYLNGDVVNSYNIGGRTVVQIDELTKCGSFEWNADDRRVDIRVFETELRNLYEAAEGKTEIIFSREPEEKYTGQVNEKGMPHGIGYMELLNVSASAGVGYRHTEKILGYFNNGKPDGNVFIERYEMAGTGVSLLTSFIGEIEPKSNSSMDYIVENQGYGGEQVKEPNMGTISLPYHYYTKYIGEEISPDTWICTSGVRYKDDGYRGQKGVTSSNWCDGKGYQSQLKTGIDKNSNPTSEFAVLLE